MVNQILKKIDNTVLDLQASHNQTYEGELKKLARLLKDPELEKKNSQLVSEVDLNSFLDASMKTGTGMSGSERLEWPEDDFKSLGLKYLLIQKLGEDEHFAFNFSHTFFRSGRKTIDSIHTLVRNLIIPFIRDYKEFIYSSAEVKSVNLMPIKNNKIFIVHGHDVAVLYQVARVIGQLGLEPIILNEQADGGKTIIEKFEINSDVGFAIVLLTPDDLGKSKNANEYSFRARQNVILELGYFMGKIGRDRVCSLKSDNVEIPSDIFGVIWTELDSGGRWKYKLGKELIAAGYSIDLAKIT